MLWRCLSGASPHLLVFDWEYGKFFAEKADALGSLQVRYWSRFLERDVVGFLIDLEQELRKLDLHLSLVKRDKLELIEAYSWRESGSNPKVATCCTAGPHQVLCLASPYVDVMYGTICFPAISKNLFSSGLVLCRYT